MSAEDPFEFKHLATTVSYLHCCSDCRIIISYDEAWLPSRHCLKPTCEEPCECRFSRISKQCTAKYYCLLMMMHSSKRSKSHFILIHLIHHIQSYNITETILCNPRSSVNPKSTTQPVFFNLYRIIKTRISTLHYLKKSKETLASILKVLKRPSPM